MADPRRILVVDDEIYILHILEFSLSMEGYEVVTASDGNEAVKKLAECNPDMVVLDVMMPGLDGFAVCREIRAGESSRAIPVILLSAKGRSQSRLPSFGSRSRPSRQVGALGYRLAHAGTPQRTIRPGRDPERASPDLHLPCG